MLAAGDAAVVLEFGREIDPAVAGQVARLEARVIARARDGELPGLLETVPTFRSLAMVLDPLVTTPAELAGRILALGDAASDEFAALPRRWCLPVRYGDASGPDLEQFARDTGSTPEEIVALHVSTEVRVYMLGFLPGFAFMGDTHPTLHRPRRKEPRVRVPAGSVGLALSLTAIYPWDSPGGWHLIGHSPIRLFDAHADSPALLAPDDRIRFREVDAQEHADLSEAAARGSLDSSAFLEDPGSPEDSAEHAEP